MTFPYPYVGPIALYNNLPINPQYYKPSQFFIEDITIGLTTLVTTTVDHNYVIGQLCRLIIPTQNGCRQLNETQGYVLEIPQTNQVLLQIDSSNGNNFQTSTAKTQPQILAIGDINTGTTNSTGLVNTGTYIPGSYINISPL